MPLRLKISHMAPRREELNYPPMSRDEFNHAGRVSCICDLGLRFCTCVFRNEMILLSVVGKAGNLTLRERAAAPTLTRAVPTGTADLGG